MSVNEAVYERAVIEVPPELRGPSNEEILQREAREDTAKRRRSAARPSKRERLRMKQEKGRADMLRVARSVSESFARAPVARPGFSAKVEPAPVLDAQRPMSGARRKLDSLFSAPRPAVEKPVVPETAKVVTAPPPVPSSGRVLKGSFGAKPNDAAKAKVYSAAELERQRMEERAKKIRAALAAKNKAAAPAVGPDGLPVKRPRGRPRKNPLP